MLSGQTIVTFDCVSWFNANIRRSKPYDLVVKPLYFDYFSLFFHGVVKATLPFLFYVFFS